MSKRLPLWSGPTFSIVNTRSARGCLYMALNKVKAQAEDPIMIYEVKASTSYIRELFPPGMALSKLGRKTSPCLIRPKQILATFTAQAVLAFLFKSELFGFDFV